MARAKRFFFGQVLGNRCTIVMVRLGILSGGAVNGRDNNNKGQQASFFIRSFECFQHVVCHPKHYPRRKWWIRFTVFAVTITGRSNFSVESTVQEASNRSKMPIQINCLGYTILKLFRWFSSRICLLILSTLFISSVPHNQCPEITSNRFDPWISPG